MGFEVIVSTGTKLPVCIVWDLRVFTHAHSVMIYETIIRYFPHL
jgi:hypothetical protein